MKPMLDVIVYFFGLRSFGGSAVNRILLGGNSLAQYASGGITFLPLRVVLSAELRVLGLDGVTFDSGVLGDSTFLVLGVCFGLSGNTGSTATLSVEFDVDTKLEVEVFVLVLVLSATDDSVSELSAFGFADAADIILLISEIRVFRHVSSSNFSLFNALIYL